MAEDIGVGGRAGYYDGIGAARDVIQNHLLQLLALTAMEEPIIVRREEPARREGEGARRRHPARGPRPLDRTRSVRRRMAGRREGARLPRRGRHEPRIDDRDLRRRSRSRSNTRRWAGVPFYLRTGKRLGRRVTEIAVVFKRAPRAAVRAQPDRRSSGQNALVIRVQPDEGVTIRFGSKVPGAGAQVRDVTMDFGYGHAFTEASPEAYERLILDVLLGDPPLFPRHEEVELSWKILDPIEEFWAAAGRPAGAVRARVVGPGIRGRAARPRRTNLEAPVIVDLPDTTVSKISRALVNVREEGGAVALGRVLTLIILTREGALEEVIEAANDASREHPMRVIVLMIDGADDRRPASTRRSASAAMPAPARSSMLRAFGEAGSSNLESLVTGLLLPDAPVVVWWPNKTPDVPVDDLDRQDRAAPDHGCRDARPTRRRWVAALGENHAPGDTDLAWTRLTHWREQLAAVLDQPPYEAGHRRRGARRRRLAVHRPARGVAAAHARCAGRLALPARGRVDATASSRCG